MGLAPGRADGDISDTLGRHAQKSAAGMPLSTD